MDIKKELSKTSIIKKCPDCHGLSLVFNVQLNKIVCGNCGYEAALRS